MAPETRIPSLLLVLVLGLTAVVYAVGLRGPLILDDYVSVVPARVEAGADWRQWLEQTTRRATGPLRRPLAYLSFVLNARWAQDGQTLRVWPYKAVNLAIHLFNTVLVWMLIERLGRCLGQDRDRRRLTALLGAAFWALHPLQVSTVLYVVQRMTLLSTTMTLIAGLVFLITHRPSPDWRRPLLGAMGVALATLTGALFKENALLTPLLLAALYAVTANPARRGDARLRLYRALVIGLPVAILLLVVAAYPGLILSGYADYPFTPFERLTTQVHVLVDYLRILVLPRPSLMAFHLPEVAVVTAGAATAVKALLLAALAVAAVALRRRRPLSALGLAWFLLAHGMESTIVPLEMAYEHRNYLPAVGLALVFADAVVALAARVTRPAAVLVGALAVLLALATLTGFRAYQWSSPYLLHFNHFRYQPESPRAIVDLMSLAIGNGDLEGADVLYRRLEAVAPLDPRTGLLRLYLACVHSEIPSRQMLAQLHLQLERGWIGTDVLSAYQQLVRRRQAGRCARLPAGELLEIADRALARQPVFVSQRKRRGWLQARAALLAARGQFDRALVTLDVERPARPDNAMLLTRVGILVDAGHDCAARRILDAWPTSTVERWLRPRASMAALADLLPAAPCAPSTPGEH